MKNPLTAITVLVTLVLLTTVWQAGGQPRRGTGHQGWEYKIVLYARLSGAQLPVRHGTTTEEWNRVLQEREALHNDVAVRMTDFGRQGWELVCFHEALGFVFKRSYDPDSRSGRR